MRESGEEYRHFLETLKEVIIMEVLSAALLLDRNRLISVPLKFRESWIRMVDGIIARADRERTAARRELRRIGARIVETKQTREYREVICRWKGTVYREKWLNEWLKAECVLRLDLLAGSGPNHD